MCKLLIHIIRVTSFALGFITLAIHVLVVASSISLSMCSAGGLGEAVCGALSDELGVRVRRLAVTGIPRSGPGSVLMDIYGISANHIVKAVKEFLA